MECGIKREGKQALPDSWSEQNGIGMRRSITVEGAEVWMFSYVKRVVGKGAFADAEKRGRIRVGEDWGK